MIKLCYNKNKYAYYFCDHINNWCKLYSFHNDYYGHEIGFIIK